MLQRGQDKEVALSTKTLENPVIKHKCIIPRCTGGGWGCLNPNYTSDIINVLSYNPIRSRASLRQSASPSKPVVFFVTSAAAVIEAALERDDAVYLHPGGQEECNWLTMITLWLIRLRAGIFSADYTEPDKREGASVGKKKIAIKLRRHF